MRSLYSMMMAMSDARRSVAKPLAFGQLGLAVGLLFCFAIRPQFLKSEGGFSNYGVVAVTVPFFTIGFLSAAVGTFLAARRWRKPLFRWALYILAALFLAVLLSTYPYKLNDFYDQLHKLLSIAFGVWELALGVWFITKRHDALNVLFFCVQLAASVASLITILGFTHLLFVGELAAGAGFGALLVRAGAQIAKANE